MQGYFHPRISEGILDPLFASAVVAENGGVRVCLVSCDLLHVCAEQVKEARQLLEEKVGVSADGIIICGTHTHTGPAVKRVCLPGWEQAIDEKWLSLLPDLICSAAMQAAGSMRETGAACLSGFEDRCSFNRRFIMKDGSLMTNPDPGNPGIVKPAGPIDPEVGVLAFGSGFGEYDGFIVNFTLHLDTVAGNKISADFPGVIKKVIGNVTGDAGFVYTSGAMGNINHLDVKRDPSYKYMYFEQAERTGGIIGSEVIKTAYRIKSFNSEAVVDGKRIQVKLPLKDFDDSSVRRAREIVSTTEADLNNAEYMSSVAVLRASALGKGEHETEIAAIRIGDAAFISMPCEYFVELGLEIKSASPFPKTFVVELGLDSLGYIPTREACEQGGYESTSSPFAPGSGEILRDAALELLESFE